MAVEIITSFEQQCDGSGVPMSGAKVYVYQSGTSTLASIYSNQAISILADNPIVCDSSGRHDMRYIATGTYKIVVKTSADITVYTRDNIDGRIPIGSGALGIANGGTGSTSAGAARTALGAASSSDLTTLSSTVAALAGAASSNEKTHIAVGTTAQRPASPAEGDIRRNTTTGFYEFYTGSAWINLPVQTGTSTAMTIQTFTSGSSATYTTPAGCQWIRIRANGGGGGSGGTGGSPAPGGTTSFNSVNAAGGSAGTSGSGSTPGSGGAGGTGGSGSATWRQPGGAGTAGQGVGAATFNVDLLSGIGGRGPLGNGANSGAGGTGTFTVVTGNAATGGGGGAGEYFELVIDAPAATYSYTVGTGGTAGTSGGAGADGRIIIEEYYL